MAFSMHLPKLLRSLTTCPSPAGRRPPRKNTAEPSRSTAPCPGCGRRPSTSTSKIATLSSRWCSFMPQQGVANSGAPPKFSRRAAAGLEAAVSSRKAAESFFRSTARAPQGVANKSDGFMQQRSVWCSSVPNPHEEKGTGCSYYHILLDLILFSRHRTPDAPWHTTLHGTQHGYTASPEKAKEK